MKVDFKILIDRLFINRNQFKQLTDDEKNNNFFMINRKLAVGKNKKINFIKLSQFFNSRFIDESTATDMWFNFFKKENRIPGWYWAPKNRFKLSSNKSSIPLKDKTDFKYKNDINEDDLIFLEKHFKEDVDYEIKKMKRFEN